jgi:hypothetical protein
MSLIRFKRFSKPLLLRQIGRDLLGRFFEQFTSDLKSSGLTLPSRELSSEEYFGSLAALLMNPENLPSRLNEALFAIDEMASPEGQARLEAALQESGLEDAIRLDSSREDIALQVWLADPALLARKHNEQRLLRLAAFRHFGCGVAESVRPAFVPPDQAALESLTADLDAWFGRHYRGQKATHVEVYPLELQYWFLVRHGDTFTRTPKVDGPTTEVLHFRPQRDDVIVYCPKHDELRINARTKGERDLYREQFGLCLRGDCAYFSEPRTYTLEPLRTHGRDALDPEGLEGIDKILLRELEISHDNSRNEVITRAAEDVFGCATDPDDLIPEIGRLSSALFEVYFADSPKPRPVQIRPPNLLKLGRHCDLQQVDQWLCTRRFRVRI